MQEFLLISTILSWFMIILNLVISLAVVRRIQEIRVPDQPELLKVGTRAPDFSLETPNGKLVSLADYKNQESLMVFVSPTCSPCRDQMPKLKELASHMEADGTRFLLVSLGAKGESQSFIEEFQIQSPVLLTEHGSPFLSDYKISGTPSYYLIDRKGQIGQGGFFDSSWQALIEKWVPNGQSRMER